MDILSSTEHLGPTVALVALAIGSIGMTAPVQGGIGAYHWMVSEGLLLYGLTKAEGLTFATISHASQNIAIIIVGVVLFVWINLKQKKNATA
jgi:glycosyltransferase 2 family protein